MREVNNPEGLMSAKIISANKKSSQPDPGFLYVDAIGAGLTAG